MTSVPQVTFKGVEYSARHGGPFDRGSADSYYCRGTKPHYFPGDTYASDMITEESMTAEEVAAYYAGYDWNERYGNKKDYN
jgi:hypothetical protein